jgi:hypothetical protein
MPSSFIFGSIAIGWFVALSRIPASPFTIDLEVQVAKIRETAHVEIVATAATPARRKVLEMKAGQPVRVRWTLRRAAHQETLKDIVVHFFATKETMVGQQAVPKLDANVAVETALTMDFKPADKAESELIFTLEKPGCYLVRLETIGAIAGSAGHEYFAAMDLIVH